MRPDLFAGPALRDDRHRILARLANGGSVPAPARQWIRWNAPQRARLAAMAMLLATGAAAWVWLQNGEPAAAPARAAALQVPAIERAPGDDAQPQAATIIPAPAPQSEPAVAPQVVAAAKPAEAKPPHPRPAKAVNAPRKQQSAAAAPEGDEDVTLLAAMLKHAKPQKPSPTPPTD